ncbi:GNAT family N-acetyltransferase [Commensalibacter oyaizuii]|uniref:GNAT family N-acetyltransferase n=1 Tax=Commensalibacter oyaizuii TaxID=3043873 RepID=A0ABT6Q1I2_9PROT|nr:GNAT family N-acetyltransferase [Commensalibacter sp. TBRC 16381]MDI2090953.1 GNAT family N-acetyltransferase [Commensalibacter sp. TBRC 16381]
MRIIFRRSTQNQFTTIFTLWQDTVKATHSFLFPSDFNAIEQEVYSFLSKTPVTIAVNEHDVITGFMLLDHAHLEALFIHPDFHNLGIGRKTINHVLQKTPLSPFISQIYIPQGASILIKVYGQWNLQHIF